MVLNSVVKLWKSAMKNKIAYVIFAVIFLASVIFKVSSAILVLLAGAAGLVIGAVRKERSK